MGGGKWGVEGGVLGIFFIVLANVAIALAKYRLSKDGRSTRARDRDNGSTMGFVPGLAATIAEGPAPATITTGPKSDIRGRRSKGGTRTRVCRDRKSPTSRRSTRRRACSVRCVANGVLCSSRGAVAMRINRSKGCCGVIFGVRGTILGVTGKDTMQSKLGISLRCCDRGGIGVMVVLADSKRRCLPSDALRRTRGVASRCMPSIDRSRGRSFRSASPDRC